jgi:hypothetical protein
MTDQQPNPSRSGRAPIPVQGSIRLILELSFFGAAAWTLYGSGLTTRSLAMLAAVVLHYATSYGRINWLLER